MTDVRGELLTKSPWKLMIKLSIPAILGQLVVGLYALVDSIFVGQMVGVEAMSAVSVASPFVLFNNGVAVLIGMGSSMRKFALPEHMVSWPVCLPRHGAGTNKNYVVVMQL